VSADPSASIWEVTRMILESPGTSPSEIAHAHGFSAVEVADLLPIFLDNLRADFSSAATPAPELGPPAQQPGESPEEHADRYLRGLAQNEHLDVVGYDTLADGGDLHADGTQLDDLHVDALHGAELHAAHVGGDPDPDTDAVLGHDPTFLDAPHGADLHVAFDDAAPVLDHHPDPGPDFADDDPFAASSHPETHAPDVHDVGHPDVIDPGEPFAMG
jgi:hypothetical protein